MGQGDRSVRRVRAKPPLRTLETRRVADMLRVFGVDTNGDPNFRDTPDRIARYLMYHFYANGTVERETDALKVATFPTQYEGMVVATDIRANGMCPHHLLPVLYRIDLGYLPKGKAIGVSKL